MNGNEQRVGCETSGLAPGSRRILSPSPRAFAARLAVLLAGGISLGASAAPKAPAPQATSSRAVATGGPSTKASPTKADLAGEGPLLFRCDRGKANLKSNHTVCTGNVVFRRGNILACCKSFEGVADAKGDFKQATCIDDVRALRGTELMWASRAELVVATSELTLLGRPMVRRGSSVIEGERVVAHINEERARIDKPKGVLVTNEQVAPPFAVSDKIMTGELPATCPLPPAPRRELPFR